MATNRLSKILQIPVLTGTVFGVKVFRGFAKLCDLASISEADIYDPKTNPTGTQRDLSPKHARDAYEYITTKELGYWPEVFLCTRKSDVLKYAGNENCGVLKLHTQKIIDYAMQGEIAISRVDGNHRLHYGDGETEGFPAVEKLVSFCLAVDLNLDAEISLFRDINNNQRRMSTSHLDNIESRLSGPDLLKKRNPALFIAQKLGKEKDSPFFERVHDGGKKTAQAFVPLRTLHTGIEYMLSRPSKLTALPDTDAKYKVIRNYFSAVKKWVPEGWTEPKRNLLLRGAGLWGICFLGAEVIDRTLSQGQFTVDNMLKVLRSGKEWDWANDGDFQGFSGRGGATKISDLIAAEFQDDTGLSVKELYKKIMNE